MNSIQDILNNDPRFKENMVSDEELDKWRKSVEEKDRVNVIKSIKRNREAVYRRDCVWGTSGKQKFTFKQWNPNFQDDKQLAYEILKKSSGITKRLATENFNVLLYGEAGTGKTAMCLAIMDALQNNTDKTVMFISVVDLRELIMYDFSDNEAAIKIKNIERSMREVDVLVLDDFGSEAGGMKNTGSASERLQQFWFRVGEARQKRNNDGNKMFSTIVTTNNDREELERMYNKKIVSRLITKKADNVIVFEGLEDLRD